MGNRTITILSFIAAVVVAFAALITYQNTQRMIPQAIVEAPKPSSQGHNMQPAPVKTSQTNNHDYAKNIVLPKPGQPVKTFTLTAVETNIRVKDGSSLAAWTYNGKVPGQEIRVQQGDFVQVELRNNLKEPVTIHWHGYPLKSAMDGVPGLDQDAVRQGETFTYAFSADVAGTYWYHSHQESSAQVDKGLYGALIVEPKNWTKPARDYTLILDEWMESPEEGMAAMPGMDMSSDADASSPKGTEGMSGMNVPAAENSDLVMAEEEMMASMYNVYTVNGKSSGLIEPLEVQNGELVRLRFINAGYRKHGIHLPGQEIRVVSSDGQDINDPQIIKDQIIMVSPGERYDVEFIVKADQNFVIDAHDENRYNEQLRIPVKVNESEQVLEESKNASYPVFDLTGYGSGGNKLFTLEEKYDIDYKVDLNTDTGNNELKYTINGKVFKELPALKLKTGNLVKMTYINNSKVDHPMHLHGHFFQMLSKNGKPASGAVITKDTLLIKPGEEYVVAFRADNPGSWVQHCHELHHASAGMMQAIEYTDFTSNYNPDPNKTFNKPE